MSPRSRRNVRGPNSALSEFLRERGISAAEIQARAQRRAAEAAEASSATPSTAPSNPRPHPAELSTTPVVVAGPSRKKAKGKGKKRKKSESDAEDNDDDDDDEFNPYAKSIPVPGQIAFCAECDSRFTVTTYSCASRDSDGLLCTSCGKKSAREEKEVKRKRTTVKRVKRDVLRQALDGEAIGPKSLKEYCIRLVAKYIDDVEALGDMSQRDMDRICQIISRNRSLNSNTIRLFLEQGSEALTLYDCARVDTDELRKIAAFVPTLKHLSLYHCGKMTDDVLQYYAERLKLLESLHIRGAFLVSRQAYTTFFGAIGPQLKSLTLSSTARTNKAVIESIVQNCYNLESLNLSGLAHFDDECLELLEDFENLQNLDVSFAGGDITDAAVVRVLNVIGAGLKELNLAGNPLLTSTTTDAIHACCAHLRVLNLNECELLSGTDIANLFTNWDKNRGLKELHLARLIEISDIALMAAVGHSGQMLEVLDVNSCSQLTKSGLMAALEGCKRLKKFDVAFVRKVDDEVVEKMQKVGITALSVWGCTKVSEVCRVEQGVSIVGRQSDIVA